MSDARRRGEEEQLETRCGSVSVSTIVDCWHGRLVVAVEMLSLKEWSGAVGKTEWVRVVGREPFGGRAVERSKGAMGLGAGRRGEG